VCTAPVAAPAVPEYRKESQPDSLRSGVVPINIRNREVEQLVDEHRQRIESLVARYRARLPAQTETPETIIGYDEHGLPS
jgi:hypothetical protein